MGQSQNQNLSASLIGQRPSGGFGHPIYMKLSIEGMHCQACVRRVEKAISAAGAEPQKVEVGSAVVAADPAQEQAVLDAVAKAGYPARRVE